jgi:hypothetical protein
MQGSFRQIHLDASKGVQFVAMGYDQTCFFIVILEDGHCGISLEYSRSLLEWL